MREHKRVVRKVQTSTPGLDIRLLGEHMPLFPPSSTQPNPWTYRHAGKSFLSAPGKDR